MANHAKKGLGCSLAFILVFLTTNTTATAFYDSGAPTQKSKKKSIKAKTKAKAAANKAKAKPAIRALQLPETTAESLEASQVEASQSKVIDKRQKEPSPVQTILKQKTDERFAELLKSAKNFEEEDLNCEAATTIAKLRDFEKKNEIKVDPAASREYWRLSSKYTKREDWCK